MPIVDAPSEQGDEILLGFDGICGHILTHFVEGEIPGGADVVGEVDGRGFGCGLVGHFVSDGAWVEG
jgi:hypothetical protein